MSGLSAWPEVFTTGDQVEVELIRGLLETSGFPVVVQTTGFKALPTFFGHSASGQYILRVPPDRIVEARALLAAPAEMPPDP